VGDGEGEQEQGGQPPGHLAAALAAAHRSAGNRRRVTPDWPPRRSQVARHYLGSRTNSTGPSNRSTTTASAGWVMASVPAPDGEYSFQCTRSTLPSLAGSTRVTSTLKPPRAWVPAWITSSICF